MRKYLSVIVFLCVIFGFTIGSAVVPSKKFSEMEKLERPSTKGYLYPKPTQVGR